MTIRYIYIVALFVVLAGCHSPEHRPHFDSSRLTSYSTSELISYLTLESVNWHYTNGMPLEDYLIRDELISRSDVPILISGAEHSADRYQYSKMIEALHWIKDERVDDYFKPFISTNVTREAWMILMHLGRNGDTNALRILNDNYFQYPTSSLEWSEAAELFGKYGYTPAISNLVDSLMAASLNLVGAADNSLRQLLPGTHPTDFSSLSEMQEYFDRRRKGTCQQ